MGSENKSQALKIGFFVACGLAVLGIAILGITSKQRIFERKVEFYSLFEDAAGLKEGSAVMFQGVEVGVVTGLDFSDDPENTLVKVRYKVSSSILPRINSDTRAIVKSMGLLGDKFISLEKTDKPTKNPINILPKSEIKSFQPVTLRELGENAQDIMSSVNELSRNVNDLVTHISKQGPLARIMNDPKLSDELVEHYKRTAESLDIVTRRLQNGEGIAGGLLAKKGSGDESAEKLRESIDNFSEIIKGINEGKGVLGLLITELNEGKDAKQSLIDFFAALEKFSQSMKDSNSLAYKLFIDEKYGEELAQNLLSISESLNSILQKVDKGEGTAGALINDKEVYDSLSLAAKGIQKSGVVKWYLEKKAREAAKDEKKKEEKMK
ncbi:MAG: MlaD family protein [Acidobacteriota bacterium]